MMLESLKHNENSFLTLTYSEENLPADGSLNPTHTQKWLKRFRLAIEPLKIRYFLVGEYGDHTFRPHYHAALFGAGPELAPIVERTWGMGHIMLTEFNIHTAQYVAGYVQKKMTSPSDPRLDRFVNGQRQFLHPEFARMSLRPGLGGTAMADVADSIYSSSHAKQDILNNGMVPMSLKMGGKSLPLGRYLRRKLSDEIGTSQEFDQAKKMEYQQEMLDMHTIAQNDPKLSPEEKLTIKSVLLRKNLQKRRNLISRTNLHKQEKTL